MALGEQEGTPALKKEIRQFVETYNINMNEFEPLDIDEYKTFKDFFTRTHRPGSRPIYQPEDASIAVVIKGNGFSIANLVMDTQIGLQFDSRAVASFRLSLQDYHWYHSPVSGKVKLFRSVPSDYYQVDAIALQSKVDILTQNRRECIVIETEDFGNILFVAIGATNVGPYGGLSIIVAFQKARVEFDQDLLDLSKQRIQVAVKVGISLGHASSI
ncbi:phosphatidylserine decarboxylase-domain-containing protein [Diaporthe sp. PMI_573]|nr:phosphatidylserine decarboxylase-domain-containing protein [Diaporthaceae sp. PMI_573]